MIRPANAEDISQIVKIWNPFIKDTTVTFSSEEKTPENVAQMIQSRRDAGREFLVAEDEGQIAGFATYDQFRGGDGYRRAMEHTVILAPKVQGMGVGRQLMTAIEAHAKAAGVHTMVAGVSGENTAAIDFHRALGYKFVALLPESGRKFDRWLDLVLLQKRL